MYVRILHRKAYNLYNRQKLSAESTGDDWEQKRIARPKGVPEWGVPPTEDVSSPSHKS
jgi:cytochrome c oxidase assembly protein subunit 16